MRLGTVRDRNLRVGGGSRIIRVDIDAVFRRIKDVSGRGNGFFHGVVALGHVRHGGNAVVVGGHGGHQLTVMVDLKGRAGQAAQVPFIAFIKHQLGFADVSEGKGHIVSAIPVHGLFLRIQFISFGCGELKHLIAAQGQGVGVELDHTGVIGDPRGVEAAVDLAKGDGRPLEGGPVLRVNFTDDQDLLRGVLDRHIIRPGGLNGHIHGIDDGISCGGFCLGEGIVHIGKQAGPFDHAASVRRS